MAITSADFLRISEELIENSDEIYYRTSASRAYYGIFHICQQLAAQLPGEENPGEGSHQRIIKKLKKNPGNEKIRTIGNLMDQMRLLRVRADYRLNFHFGKSLAEQLIFTAKEIQSMADRISV